MSTTEPVDTFEDDDPNDSPVIKQLRKQTRDQANELKTLREQAEQASAVQKENTLYKANLGNLNEAQQKAILATSAEATEAAYRSQAEALGFIEPAAPAAPAEELAALDRITNAQTGGTAPDPTNYEAEIGAARNEAEVMSIMAKYGRATPIID